METQTQIDRLIELAIIQRSELKQLVEQLPQLREHLNAEIERTFEEAEPQIRTELEEFVTRQAADKTATLGTALEAKIGELAKSLEESAQAKYSALIATRDQNATLLAQAEERIAAAAGELPAKVKDIVAAELARFPRAGEIDQLRKEFAEPRGLNPRGKWQAGQSYNKLDLVTINGDSYTSNTDNNITRPTRSSSDWTLVAARGAGGGGGPTSLSELTTVPSNGDILIGSGTSWVTSNLTAGAGISITVGAGEITISATDGDITLDDGTAASPSLHFTNDADTGLYRPAANTLGISVSGTQVAYFDTNGLTIPSAGVVAGGSFHGANGNANNPTFSFQSDQDTGMYRHATNELGFTVGGTEKAVLTSTTFTVTPNLVVSGTGTINGTSIPASKTLVVTTDKLSALASTSSSELAGVISDETGTGALVFANTPTLVTPVLGTPNSGTLTNCTGLPVSSGISGLGTGVATFLATPSSANLASAVTDETGTGALVFANTPTLVTPNIGAATGTSVNLSGAGTFGGNLTVSGASGGLTNLITGNSSAGNYIFWDANASPSASDGYSILGVRAFSSLTGSKTQVFGIDVSKSGAGTDNKAKVFFNLHNGTNLAPFMSVTDARDTTLAGNLTVSGTGTSSFASRLFGINTTSPDDIGAAYSTLQLNAWATGGGAYAIYKNVADSVNFRVGADGQGVLNVVSNHPLLFATFNAERARITASGNLLLKSDGVDSANGKLQLASHTTSAGGIGFGTDNQLFRYNGVQVVLTNASGTSGSAIASNMQLRVENSGNGGIQVNVPDASTGGVYFGRAADAYYSGVERSGTNLQLRNNGTTALTVDSSQNATFAGTGQQSFNGLIQVAKTAAGANSNLLDLYNKGTTNNTSSGIAFSANNASSAQRTSAEIRGVMTVTTAGSEESELWFSTRGAGVASGTTALKIANSGNATFGGSITTATPSGGTAGAWKLGVRVAATTTLDTTQYLQVDIGGTLYKVALVTS